MGCPAIAACPIRNDEPDDGKCVRTPRRGRDTREHRHGLLLGQLLFAALVANPGRLDCSAQFVGRRPFELAAGRLTEHDRAIDAADSGHQRRRLDDDKLYPYDFVEQAIQRDTQSLSANASAHLSVNV